MHPASVWCLRAEDFLLTEATAVHVLRRHGRIGKAFSG